MNKKSVSKRVSRITFNVCRKCVRAMSVIAVLLVCSFVFLRLYGVPGPILREMIKRANAAGIPIHVDSVMLTLRGWKASNVTYYSKNPDDLGPIFQAREVLFDWKQELATESAKGRKLEFEALGIRLSPSVEWGVNIPEGSNCRGVDRVKLSLRLHPDRVEFIDGAMTWMGIDFTVNGQLLKKDRKTPGARGSRPKNKPEKKQETVLPVYVSSQQFQTLETRLKSLKVNGEAQVDVEFLIDAEDFSESTIDFSVAAQDISIRDVGFDEMEISGHYGFPELQFESVRVGRNNQSLDLEAAYDLNTKLIQANIKNSITSRQLLLLTPQVILDLLVKAELQFEQLPQFSLRFGPCEAKDLLNAVSGSFSIRDVSYCGLVVESARGKVDRSDNRLELSQIHAAIEGQEDRAEEVGSSLHGGSMEGSVYWDANKGWFGVKVEGSMDPNLFLQPLAIVPVATNAIGRFQFPEKPPHISLELGSSYVDWSTFFIQVQGMGNDVRFHDGLLSTVNTTAFYTNALLTLDPLAITSGIDFMKGTAYVNFRDTTVGFDALSSISPALMEDAIYSRFDLFGNKINTSGNTHIRARGALDWETMEATGFRAEVEAERLEIPVAGLDHFSAVVTGDGPLISVSNAVFEIYGGPGKAEFSIRLDPATNAMPYALDLVFSDAELNDCLRFVDLPCRKRTKGKLAASAKFKADMREDFFESANGSGTASVLDGELADMPLFSGFSKLMRKVVPGFKAFSITRLFIDFKMVNGVLHSDNAAFEGDIFNAKASGLYSTKTGFDAEVQVQMLNDKGLSKVIRVITDPLFKLFKLRLNGMLDAPSWKLDNFTSSSRSGEQKKEADVSD